MNSVLSKATSINSCQTLSQLMNTVQQIVKKNFLHKIWITAEILKIQKNKSGHVYLQLADKNEDGVECTARGVVWANNVEIIDKFERETKIRLEENLNLMILVEVRFHEKHGLNLNIISIDSSHSIGAYELKLQQIRERLNELGEANRNRNLSKPQDFFRVAVIAPEGAAGLGDFRSKADILERKGLCHFDYYYAQFQGKECKKTIVLAFSELIQNDTKYDVVCVIRGGGEKAALNELSQSGLARAVCRCKYPVYTGIGHKDDNVLLDEYAHTSFATPSMLISHIQHTIVSNALDARRSYVSLQNRGRSLCAYQEQVLQQHQMQIQSGIEATMSQWRFRAERLRMRVLSDSQKNISKSKQCAVHNLHFLHKSAQQQVNKGRTTTQGNQQLVTSNAQQLIHVSRKIVEKSNGIFTSSSRSSLLRTQHFVGKTMRLILVQAMKTVSEQKQLSKQHALSFNRNSRTAIQIANHQVVDKIRELAIAGRIRIRQKAGDLRRMNIGLSKNARSSHSMHQQHVEQNFKLISAYDPQKTLERGYALIFDNSDRVVKSISEIHQGQQYQIKLRDGTVVLRNHAE